jgi:hypothetical protein
METKLKIEKQDLNASPITEEHSLFFGKVFRGMSAYQYAVESGLFSGTEEEFAQYLGNIENVTNACEEATESTIAAKDNAVQATANAIAAKEAAESATANATQATADANTATNNAVQATEATNEAIARAESATNEATQATANAKTATANANTAANRANEEVEKLKEKADIDGNYPSMTVGKAENLVGRGEATEEYINFRQSAGEVSIEDGSAKITKIKGNSVVWNNETTIQKGGNFVATAIPNGNRFTPTGPASAPGSIQWSSGWVAIVDKTKVDFSHKHLIMGTYTRIGKRTDIADFTPVEPVFAWRGSKHSFNVEEGKPFNFVLFTTASQSTETNCYFSLNDCVVDITNVECIDLTKMFEGGNEPKNIDEFNKRMLVGLDKFAYNEGEIISMTADSLVSVGENAYDKRVGYAKVLGGKTYNFEGTYTSLEFATTLDSTREAITLDENNKYTFEQEGYAFAEGSDICINIQHSYEKPFMHQYQESEIRFDFIKTIKDSEGNLLFPNGLRSAGSAYDEIRYNATTKKWEAVKRIGEVDLGSLNWGQNSHYGFYIGIDALENIKRVENNDAKANILCARYSTGKGARIVANNGANTIGLTTTHLVVGDLTFENNQDFKNSLTEVAMLYELAEPIKIELDTNFNPTYLVWDFGTEEAIASVPSAPFRADIVYQFNAVDRIRNNSDRIAELEAQIASLMQTMNAIQTTNMEE